MTYYNSTRIPLKLRNTNNYETQQKHLIKRHDMTFDENIHK